MFQPVAYIDYSKTKNGRIEILRQFSPDGIEINFSSSEALLNFKLNKRNKEYLRSLKFNSIHAPCVGYGDNMESRDILRKLSELYRELNARNVVFHKDGIENYDLITSNSFVSSLENDDWRKQNNNIEYFENLLAQNKKLWFTFDIAHAISVSSSGVSECINRFADRLIEVHFSVINRTGKHDFAYKYDDEDIRRLFQLLKNISAPLVLEGCTILNRNEVGAIEEEINYIRDL